MLLFHLELLVYGWETGTGGLVHWMGREGKVVIAIGEAVLIGPPLVAVRG